MLFLVACTSPDTEDAAEPWGSEAVRFYDALATAYAGNDFYGVLDFYETTAEIEKWRGAVRGGLPVSDLVRWNSADLGHEVLAVHLGLEGATTIIRWDSIGDVTAVEGSIDRGLISSVVEYDQAATKARSLRALPEIVAAYEARYAAYADAWTAGRIDEISLLYAPDATVYDLEAGMISGRNAVVAAGTPGVRVEISKVAAGDNDSGGGLEVHLGPGDFADDPGRSLGVFSVTDEDGCTYRVAVSWAFVDGKIAEERRYHEIESFRACSADPPEGWWIGLELPGPHDEVVTSVLKTPGGQEVEIHNGTARLENLVLGGLERFAAAGLAEPDLGSVTFEPSRACADRTGRLIQDSVSRTLFICLYETDLCTGNDDCEVASINRRVALLHELGHAWLLDQIDDDTRSDVLEIAGRQVWQGEGAPWSEQGVEYAAETLAWGLLDESISMVRIGTPDCDELRAAFVRLTLRDPLRDPKTCAEAS